MTTSLTLTIDGDSLHAILAARLRLVVAKPVDAAGPQVAWLAFTPFEGNRITWDGACALYVGRSVAREGCVVEVAATQAAATSPLCYPSAGARFAGHPIRDPHVRAEHYGVRNDDRVPRTFGLMQDATINGTPASGPLNATVVSPGYTSDFAPADTVHVWLARDVAPGSIVGAIPDGATTIRFGGTDRARTYRYDARAAAFVRCSDRRGRVAEQLYA